MPSAFKPAYPEELAQWWLRQACAAAGVAGADACLDRLAPEVARLSDALTLDRADGFRDYARQPFAWLAYNLFYFPQTFTRLRLVLDELKARGEWDRFPAERPLRLLDLGAGTGAGTLAAALACSRRRLEITALDAADFALGWLRRLFGELRPELAPKTVVGDLRHPDVGAGWDIILANYALNEAFPGAPDDALRGWLAKTMALLNPTGMLIICDPVIQAAGPRLQILRAWALEAGAHVLAPCLHEKPCPMLAGEPAWCHDVREWYPPGTLQYLNRHLHRAVADLKYSFLVLSPKPARFAGGGDWGRLVAPVHRPKGQQIFTVCAGDGNLHRPAVLDRTLGALRRPAAALERGHIIHCPRERRLGDGSWRAELKAILAGAPK